MNKEKLSLVLDLYKDGKIDKDQAFQLLDADEITLEPSIIPIEIHPWYPQVPWNPFGPTVVYASDAPKVPEHTTISTVESKTP